MATATNIDPIRTAYLAAKIPYAKSGAATKNRQDEYQPIRSLNYKIYDALHTVTATEGGMVATAVRQACEGGKALRNQVHAVDILFETIKIFLTTCKAIGGATPRSSGRTTPASRQSSSPASPGSPKSSKNALDTLRNTDSSVKRDGVLKVEALERDGYRCVYSAYMSEAAPSEEAAANPNAAMEYTEGAHIVPFSIQKVRGAGQHLETALNLFGHPGMDLGKVDVLPNIITLWTSAHQNFGKFNWMVDTSTTADNAIVYTIAHLARTGSRVRQMANALQTVVDGDTLLLDGKHAQRPDPRYFDLHAKIGRVLHASGFGGIVEKFLRDNEDEGAVTVPVIQSVKHVNEFLSENDWVVPGHQEE
ncbi:uncharacterized protein EV422DRAFT_578707 [Fimicolochytrium jonesii]|uniref:uncharacterized protein n=1 Tax=Fimicolochytrium jonesii TaxID=1396493 RepID=UPI0022FF4549|nr:uncharacterized protein EV422DRAFT_578707 [Fimicolochytrium jonesii]KAI8820355.1 hypothetical protein EV422DRAFT_578707 [Fimicolochytrium jonesii]